MKHGSQTWFFVLLLILLFVRSASIQPQTSKEYQIKAVFLFNFTQFIEWPGSAFGEASDPFVIGIVGDDPFGPYLDETIRGENLDGHPLVVKRFKTPDEVEVCHILFVNMSDRDDIKNAFDRIKSHSVLTVGDVANFGKQGGMIRFITENNKTRIRINLEAAREADLTISSKLLKLAEIVETQSN